MSSAARREASSAVSGSTHQPARSVLWRLPCWRSRERAALRTAISSNQDALDENLFRGERDFRVGAAHDAADTNGPGAVAIVNDRQRGIEGALKAVESANFFAGFCAADTDAVIADFVVVVRMKRMAELEHNVVGDVDGVADASDAARFETILEPFWK